MPQDLTRHVCISHRKRADGWPCAWEFEKDGHEIRVRVEGQLSFSMPVAVRDAAASGFGIAYLPEHMAERALRGGTLVQVLDDWSPQLAGYHLYYPSPRQNSAELGGLCGDP